MYTAIGCQTFSIRKKTPAYSATIKALRDVKLSVYDRLGTYVMPFSPRFRGNFHVLNTGGRSVFKSVPYMGRDSSVGIATRYGLDGPRIESGLGGGPDFLHLSSPAVGPTQPYVKWVPGSFLGGKAAGAWR
jgi:hypothetical protein